eukprot:CAMPEP_0202876156 /NCGR_PEP_ID=MMETSP1391-20130828/28557_1 /ASSEMBLY_ACC=CAM_ASM_000867 /TAXON_ID=1034604 /ORGANISM="Chlamydomonas leiostraca, Strain SAG 11-49" /LENGTH=140 /DNA_ID=CAMNT_0049557941 /DNA_START=117 /DNA_END=539 /DNA_ORIENTATION=+
MCLHGQSLQHQRRWHAPLHLLVQGARNEVDAVAAAVRAPAAPVAVAAATTGTASSSSSEEKPVPSIDGITSFAAASDAAAPSESASITMLDVRTTLHVHQKPGLPSWEGAARVGGDRAEFAAASGCADAAKGEALGGFEL